jgi:hypothetical protein
MTRRLNGLFAEAAHGANVETFALVSAIGAATNSMFFYGIQA